MQASPASNETRLPRAVLKRSREIEEKLRLQREPKTEPTPEAPPVDPSAEAVTTAEATPPTPAAPVVPPTDPRESDPAYWKQRFNVTQGVLRTERQERQAETADFRRQLSELQEQIRTLQASAPAPAAAIDLGEFFTPEQIEEIGEEQCKAIVATAQRTARTQAQTLIEAELKPLREERQQERESAEQRRQREFLDHLTELVPNYAEIDESDDWKAWLAQEDESTGLQRGVVLDQHVKKRNAPKTAKVFEAYIAASTPPPPPAPPIAPRGNAASASEATPVRQAPAQGAPTAAEVKEFYKRAALGKVSAQERAQFEDRMKLRRRPG